ncbi:MAG: hypothetical protein ACREDA_03815, partial [Methylocella sp.]
MRLGSPRRLGFCIAPLFAFLLLSAPSRAEFSGNSVRAQGCASAFGGNVNASTINVICGLTPEVLNEIRRPYAELNASQKEVIQLLRNNLDINSKQISAALEIVGEANVPPEKLGAKLVEIAKKFKDLQTVAAAQPGDDAKITALKADAQKAIQDGQLGKADDLLADVEKIEGAALEHLALNAAQTAAQRGDVALTRLRYVDAAKRFAEAASTVPAGHEDERWKYLNQEAVA